MRKGFGTLKLITLKWKGENKFPPFFTYLIDLAEVYYTRRRHLPSSNCEFFENRCRESRATIIYSPKSVNDCCPHLFHVLLRIRDFRENRRGEGHDFCLIGVHEVTLALVPLNCSTSESKDDVCVCVCVCVCAGSHSCTVVMQCHSLSLQICQTSCSTFASCSLRRRCEVP